MQSSVVVIGGGRSGCHAVKLLKQLAPSTKVTVIEQQPFVGFDHQVLEKLLGGSSTMQEATLSLFDLRQVGVDVISNATATHLDVEGQKIAYCDLAGREQLIGYERLILSLGRKTELPARFLGAKFEAPGRIINGNVAVDVSQLAALLKTPPRLRKAAVFLDDSALSVQILEPLCDLGYLVECYLNAPQIMSGQVDSVVAGMIQRRAAQLGVVFNCQHEVTALAANRSEVALESQIPGKLDALRHKLDFVVGFWSAGPNSGLYSKIEQLKKNCFNQLIINQNCQTSIGNIYAIGSISETRPALPAFDGDQTATGNKSYNFKQATMIAHHIAGNNTLQLPPPTGLQISKLFGYYVAFAGHHIDQYQKDRDVKLLEVYDAYRPEFMPTFDQVRARVVYNNDKKILGFCFVSDVDIFEIANIFAVALSRKISSKELAIQDFFFNPWYSKPWGIIQQICLNMDGMKVFESYDL